jgi:oligoribonuclease
MTGLDPSKDRILEVAAIATDFNFRDIAQFESAVKVDERILNSRMTGDFWDKFHKVRDELKAQNQNAKKSSREVEKDLLAFVHDNFDLQNPIYLAGNSIHQDQKFIEREWKDLAKMLNYRQLDVSAWKIIFENRGAKFQKPENHRAVDDIRGSIAELKYYLTKIDFKAKNSRNPERS